MYMMVLSQQVNIRTDIKEDIHNAKVNEPTCKTGFPCNFVKGRGYLKWT